MVSTHTVPSDGADHWVSGLCDIIGCNRLACQRCGRPVRSAPDLRPAAGSLKKKLTEMAASQDWTELEFLERSSSGRLYACDCHWFHAVSRHLTQDQDPDRRQDINFPWACAGHPPPTIPLTVDDLPIEHDTDIARLASRALSEGAPAGASLGFREYPAGWLGRIYYRLRDLPEAEALGQAVGELLFSDDPELVGGALAFYRVWRSAPGRERVLELADRVGAAKTFPSKFGVTKAVPSKWDRFLRTEIPESPGATLTHQVRDLESVPKKVLGHLETLACAPGAGGMNSGQLDGLFAALAAHDGEFLAREAASIALGDDRRAGAVLRALQGTKRAELVVVAGTALINAGGYEDALERFLGAFYSHGEPWTPVLRLALAEAARS